MKDTEVLLHLTEDWKTVNSIKKSLNLNWEKLLSHLRGLELKGLVESFEIKQRKNVIRFYRLVKTDSSKLSIIQRTPIEDRSTTDHKYLIQHKYKGNIRKYIEDIIFEVKKNG